MKTLKVYGDMLAVYDADGGYVGMVQPDTYRGYGWTAWIPNLYATDRLEQVGEFNDQRDALGALGYIEDGT